MSLLFRRAYRFVFRGPIDNREDVAIEITNLRISFKICKTIKAEPNTAEIKLYNLSESTRGQMKKKGSQVFLEAGYGTDLSQLFIGDVREINHEKHGPDWCTTILAGDGERSLAQARSNVSLKPGTKVADAIKTVAKSMEPVGVYLDAIKDPFGELADLALDNGFTAIGPTKQTLTKILEGTGFSWSIQDGKLQVKKDYVPFRDNQFLWDKDSGLEGSPSYIAPSRTAQSPQNASLDLGAGFLDTKKIASQKKNVKSGTAPGSVKAKGRLNGLIVCGSALQIESKYVSGVFTVNKLEHSGDTWGNEWTTEIEGSPSREFKKL